MAANSQDSCELDQLCFSFCYLCYCPMNCCPIAQGQDATLPPEFGFPGRRERYRAPAWRAAGSPEPVRLRDDSAADSRAVRTLDWAACSAEAY